MKQALRQKEAGVGHLGLIIAVVVVLAIGGVGWFVYNRNKSGTSAVDQAIATAIKNAKCTYDDKDLCKFFASYKAQTYFTINSTTVSEGRTNTMLLKTEGKDKSYTKFGGETSYEVIGIGQTTYTKAPNGTWWKQTVGSDVVSNVPAAAQFDLQEPETASDQPATQTTYKKLGKEKCGNLTCFKYQEVDPHDSVTKTYIWFDDQDYQLRRDHSEGLFGTSDATYSYGKVSITEPSPVKELGPNQYLIPGQNEPTTLPSGGSMPTPEDMQQYN